jgi:hypothetical protein
MITYAKMIVRAIRFPVAVLFALAFVGCQTVDREKLLEQRREDADNFYSKQGQAFIRLTPNKTWDMYRR